MKKNSSVHKSLLLFSLPLPPPGVLSGEREKKARGQTGQNPHWRKQRSVCFGLVGAKKRLVFAPAR